MSDLTQRLLDACVGHPHATIPWPHRLLHEAAAEIDRLRARVAELEAERDAWRYSAKHEEDKASRLRAALEAAPEPTEPGPYHMETVQQREWHNYRHWFLTTRAEALK